MACICRGCCWGRLASVEEWRTCRCYCCCIAAAVVGETPPCLETEGRLLDHVESWQPRLSLMLPLSMDADDVPTLSFSLVLSFLQNRLLNTLVRRFFA
jgi:hypothetical protein